MAMAFDVYKRDEDIPHDININKLYNEFWIRKVKNSSLLNIPESLREEEKEK